LSNIEQPGPFESIHAAQIPFLCRRFIGKPALSEKFDPVLEGRFLNIASGLRLRMLDKTEEIPAVRIDALSYCASTALICGALKISGAGEGIEPSCFSKVEGDSIEAKNSVMASLTKHPQSRFWVACYTAKDGRQLERWTKTMHRAKAMAIALELERVELQTRQGTVKTTQLQKIASGHAKHVRPAGPLKAMVRFQPTETRPVKR
jgi:hypothetical protein